MEISVFHLSSQNSDNNIIAIEFGSCKVKANLATLISWTTHFNFTVT